MKKVLIITAKYGSGHEIVAKAVASELSCRDNISVKILDFSKIVGKFVDQMHKRLYDSNAPYFPIYTLFALFTNNPIMYKYIDYFYFHAWKNLRNEIEDFNPDIVVSTYPAGNWGIAVIKQKYKYKLVTLITDLVGLHAYWVAPGTDRYIVAKPETGRALEKFGVDKSIIFEGGYPLRKEFYKEYNKDEIKNKMGIDRTKFVSLYFLNTAPPSFAYKLARELDSMPELHSIIVCGKNLKLFKRFKRTLKNTLVLGYVEDISRYFHAADVTIGKAGPGFLMESFVSGCPVILTNYVAPQETGNLKYVIDNKLGFYEPSPKKVINRLKKIIGMPEKKKRELIVKERKSVHFNATAQIADYIVSQLKI